VPLRSNLPPSSLIATACIPRDGTAEGDEALLVSRAGSLAPCKQLRADAAAQLLTAVVGIQITGPYCRCITR